jgi:hypothetical protein
MSSSSASSVSPAATTPLLEAPDADGDLRVRVVIAHDAPSR